MKKNNNETGVKRSFASLFTNNIGLKLLSLLFAIILWSYVISETNPMRQKTIVDLPVTVTGLNTLNENGLTTRNDLSKQTMTVRVNVNVPGSDYRNANINTIEASIDLSKITTEGTQNIPIKVAFDYGEMGLVSASPDSIEVQIDRLQSANVPVHYETSGTLSEGLLSVAPSISPTSIDINGPGYYISKIARGIVDVDLTKMKDGYTFNSPVRFVDAENNTVALNRDYSVFVDMDIKTVKSVPFDLSSVVVGSDKIDSRFEFTAITAKTETVKIFGDKESIDSITMLQAESIDLSGATDALKEVELVPILPEGVELVSPNEKFIAVLKITEKNTEKALEKLITVTGAPTGKTIQISSDEDSTSFKAGTGEKTLSSFTKAKVTLFGPVSKLSKISSSDISVKLVLTGKGEGTYEVEPVLVLASEYSGVTGTIQSPSKITAKISG